MTQRKIISWPLCIALVTIAGVWAAGAVWSFGEQTLFARAKHFDIPQLLPLVLDGFAVAMASVAWASSMDGRSAGFARCGTLVAIAGSATSNSVWAWERAADVTTVVIAAAVPVVSGAAFEVLLGEIRHTVQRSRGLPVPVPITGPRPIRLILSPWKTFAAWRRLVLAATDPALTITTPGGEPDDTDTDHEPDDPPADLWQYSWPVREAESIITAAAAEQTSTGTAERARGGVPNAARLWISERLGAGQPPTGAEVAAAFGAHPTTGRRWVRLVRAGGEVTA